MTADCRDEHAQGLAFVRPKPVTSLKCTRARGERHVHRAIRGDEQQDLVALLYFLAVLRAAGERGQARVLILDDVLQSVDAGIRVALMIDSRWMAVARGCVLGL